MTRDGLWICRYSLFVYMEYSFRWWHWPFLDVAILHVHDGDNCGKSSGNGILCNLSEQKHKSDTHTHIYISINSQTRPPENRLLCIYVCPHWIVASSSLALYVPREYIFHLHSNIVCRPPKPASKRIFTAYQGQLPWSARERGPFPLFSFEYVVILLQKDCGPFITIITFCWHSLIFRRLV